MLHLGWPRGNSLTQTHHKGGNMKKLTALIILALVLAATLSLNAAPTNAISVYISGAIISTNVPGGVASNAYICIPSAAITNSEYTATMVTNDIRPFLSTLVRTVGAAIDAQSSSNQFSTFSITESMQWNSATNRTIFRKISDGQTFTLTPTY